MSSAKQDTGCCGENLRSTRISLLGIFTLSFPLAVMLRLIGPLVRLLASGSSARMVSAVAAANERLIAEAPVFPRSKCRVTALVYDRSPRLSGFVYRNFNFLLCLLTACGGLLVVYGLWSLI